MTQKLNLKIKQVITFPDLLKGLLSISWRIPYLLKVHRELSSLHASRYAAWNQLLERNAEKYPNNIALKWDESSLTYKELNEGANRFAHYFLAQGLKKGDVISILLENRPELFMIYLAAAKLGAIAAALNTNLREESLLYCLNHTSGSLFIVGEEIITAFQNVKNRIDAARENNLYFVPDAGGIDTPPGFMELKQKVEQMPTHNPAPEVKVQLKDPLAYVYTSGTTGGKPKAAVINHLRLIRSTLRYGKFLQRIKPRDTIYCPLPFFHTNGLAVGWPMAAAKGASLAIRRKFSATRFWDDIRKFKATHFIYVGELPRYILNQPVKPDEKQHQLKTIIGNGLRPEVWQEFKRRFGIKKVYEFYGAAESAWGFVNLLNIFHTVGLSWQPHAFVRCDIDTGLPLRSEDGFVHKVHKGEPGLLLFQITERYKFPGYTDKKATEEKILHNVFEKGDAWLNTGDLMRNMGYRHAQFVDRLGDSFRWKGENVSTTEVEDAVNSMPGIDLAAAFGVKVPFTEGRAGMAAVVTTQKISDMDLKTLWELFQVKLPAYAVPLFLRFKSQLEATATAKLQKTELANESFDPNLVKDKLYVLLPQKSEYIPLTKEIYAGIQKGEYRF